MIELQSNSLRFSFPEVHEEARCSVSFIRTLRIPDDDREYPLPPGFSRFPLQHVDDYASRVPDSWSAHGGVFLPMYQTEALWLSFDGDYPMALKIAAGKTCALTGEPWHDRLTLKHRDAAWMRRRGRLADRLDVALPDGSDQDYLVIPEQPWLDGFYAGKGLIRQFVAMPLGGGYTAEEQMTGEAEHGGLQIAAYPMKAEEYERRFGRREVLESRVMDCRDFSPGVAYSAPDMGLAPGGLMRQEVYEDEFGVEAWDQSAKSRCFVHILNSVQYVQVTQEKPPTKPPTASEYEEAGLPWFDHYGAELKVLESPSKLLKLKSLAELMEERGESALPDNETLTPGTVVGVSKKGPLVREGEF